MPSPHPRRMSIGGALLILAGVVLALVVLAMGTLWWKQEALLFAPTVLPAGTPLAQAPDIHELTIDVPGAKLSALQLRLPNPKGIVFFLHGNGGSLKEWFVNPEYYRRLNLDLFMVDYRGYGKSTGRIENEAQLRADVRAVWATVAPQYAGRKVIIYGRSLGTGLAAGLAVEMSASHPPDLTVLVSPYTSMAALSDEYYPWVPGWLMRYPMRTDALISQIRGPLLLVHGEQDPLIKPRHTAALHALVPQAQVLMVPGGAHNDLQEFPVYLDGLAKVYEAL